MRQDGRVGALRQAGEHAEGQVGRSVDLVEHRGQHERQTLAAVLGRGTEAGPASLGIAAIGLHEPARDLDGPVRLEAASLAVAYPVEGLQHLLGETCGCAEDRPGAVPRQIGEVAEVIVACKAEHILEEEEHLLDGSRVAWHAGLAQRA